MPDAIQQLRDQTEADLGALMRRLSARQRREVRAAIDRYGSVRAVPAEVWEGFKQELDQEAASLILLLLIGSYRTQSRRISRSADPEQRQKIAGLLDDEDALRASASAPAARMGRRLADEYVDGARNRLATRIDDKAEELNQLPPAEASRRVRKEIDDAIGEDAGESAAVTNTTRAMTVGQGSAADDIGRTVGAQPVAHWRTERTGVCPICKPLNGQPIDKWEEILHQAAVDSRAYRTIVEQLGPPAHPNCRCHLYHVFVAASN